MKGDSAENRGGALEAESRPLDGQEEKSQEPQAQTLHCHQGWGLLLGSDSIKL